MRGGLEEVGFTTNSAIAINPGCSTGKRLSRANQLRMRTGLSWLGLSKSSLFVHYPSDELGCRLSASRLLCPLLLMLPLLRFLVLSPTKDVIWAIKLVFAQVEGRSVVRDIKYLSCLSQARTLSEFFSLFSVAMVQCLCFDLGFMSLGKCKSLVPYHTFFFYYFKGTPNLFTPKDSRIHSA